MNFAYLSALIFSLSGLAALDIRYRLVIGRNPRAAARVLPIGVGIFLLWDAAGILSGIFFPGASWFDTGWMLAPGLPVEELGFLTLLCYLTLLIWEYRK